MRLFLRLFVTLPFFPYFLNAQPVRIEHLTTRRGLSHDVVTSIMHDPQGYLWLGTTNGLNRYDGYGFRVFSQTYGDTTSLPVGLIRTTYIDRRGTFWIGMDGHGLIRFDPLTGRCRGYRHDPHNPRSLGHDDVYFVGEDPKGNFWVGTYGGGLHRFDPATGHFTRFVHDPRNPHTLSSNYAESTYIDRAGILWVGTEAGTLNRFDPATGHVTRYHPHPGAAPAALTDVTGEAGGPLWLATDGDGLFRFDPATGRAERFAHDPADAGSLGHNNVSKLLIDRNGALWAGTRGGGLSRRDPRTGRFSRYQHHPMQPNTPASNTIFSLYEDRAGLLWAGTQGHGLDKINPGRPNFETYAHNPLHPEGLADNAVRAVYEASPHAVWVGTNGSGLDCLDPATGKARHFLPDSSRPGSLHGVAVMALLPDPAGKLWVATYDGGLNQLDPRTGRFAHYAHDPADANSLADNRVLALCRDRDGTLWVGTFEGGLDRLDLHTKKFIHHRHRPGDPHSLSSDGIRCLYEDRRGNLWVGTAHGLNVLDRQTGRFRRFHHDPKNPHSLSGDAIRCIYEDAGGTLWVGTTDGGINGLRYPDGRVTRYTRKDGLPGDGIFGILGDDRGNLWISTNNGLAWFTPRGERFKVYQEEDGLQGNAFSFGGYHRGRSGKLYFGGTKGLSAFYPDSVRDDPFIPPVVITNLEVQDRPRPELLAGKPIRLKPDENSLTFEFAALGFNQTENQQYAYQLEGVDEDWVQSNSRRYVRYAGLDGGAYVFRVIASNGDGVWNREGVRLPVYITPPLWQQRPFRAALVLLTALALWGLYRVRVRQVEARNRQLQELVRSRTEAMRLQSRQLKEVLLITRRQQREAETLRRQAEEANRMKTELMNIAVHDLKNPLGGIMLYADLVKDAVHEPDRAARLTQTIKETAQGMFGLISNLLTRSRLEGNGMALQKERLDVALLVQEAVAHNTPQAQHKEQQLLCQEEPGCVADVDPDLLGEAIENLVSNAVKFTPKGKRIWVAVGRTSDTIRITVRDEGLGIRPDELGKLFVPFGRLSARPTGGESSNGLGLVIVKRIVELHGGTVTAHSGGRHQGATFTATLPAAATTGNDQPGSASA
jgi:ligand-binding sensor domain-containing protein/signal transduction histidine kinase